MKNNLEIDQNIELYFFDPNKNKDEFINYYKKVKTDRCSREKGYRYSPLFYLLKDIRYCFGARRQFNAIRGNNFDTANFAGIVLIHLAFQNLVKRFYNGRYSSFAKNFMGIDNLDYVEALDLLRNALVHNNYSLALFSEKRQEKVNFSLEIGPIDLITRDPNWKKPYKSSLYRINPRKLMSAFEKGCLEYKKHLLDRNNQKDRIKFAAAFDVDQWTFISDPSVSYETIDSQS